MSGPIPTFDEYVASLSRLSPHVDPTLETEDSARIRAAARSLTELGPLSLPILAEWVRQRPEDVPVLGLAVGLSQEKLKNALKDRFNTSGWLTLARDKGPELISALDEDFGLLRLLDAQRNKDFEFGDVLIARGSGRQSATRAGVAGRSVEDEIERIAQELGLRTATRTRFTGRSNRTAPCDLAIMDDQEVAIAVAAKGFDSTGSKLTDSVREVKEMAEVRLARQSVMVVIDGIGWKSRVSDLRAIHHLWETNEIDGMYTLNSLDSFSRDLESAARLRRLL